MFCPNCGANNTTEQRFCRACGLNLEDTAKSLLLQIPSAEGAKLLRQEKSLERFGGIVFSCFGIILLGAIGGIIYAIITGLILSGKNPLLGVFLTVFTIFAALMLVYVGLREDLKEKKKRLSLEKQKEFAEPKITGKLLEEKPFEPASSVTENSTELFVVENKTRKLE